MSAARRKYRYAWISAVTGRYVTAAFAKRRPATTYRRRFAKCPALAPRP